MKDNPMKIGKTKANETRDLGKARNAGILIPMFVLADLFWSSNASAAVYCVSGQCDDGGTCISAGCMTGTPVGNLGSGPACAGNSTSYTCQQGCASLNGCWNTTTKACMGQDYVTMASANGYCFGCPGCTTLTHCKTNYYKSGSTCIACPVNSTAPDKNQLSACTSSCTCSCSQNSNPCALSGSCSCNGSTPDYSTCTNTSLPCGNPTSPATCSCQNKVCTGVCPSGSTSDGNGWYTYSGSAQPCT